MTACHRMLRSVCSFCIICAIVVNAYIPSIRSRALIPSAAATKAATTVGSKSKTSLNVLHDINSYGMLQSLLRVTSSSEAKSEFYLFFFGGSGGLTVGLNQVPKIIKEYEELAALGGGPTLGGETLQLNPISTIGFPESLSKADVLKVIKEAPSAGKLSSLGLKKTYMSQQGYLELDAFNIALKNCNPLVRYAVFEAISSGSGNVCSPVQYEACLAKWRQEAPEGINSFKSDLLKASLKRLSAYSVFALLVALVFDLIIESGNNAFFLP